MTLTEIRSLVPETIRDPQGTARHLIALKIPRQAIWLGTALVSVLTVLLLRLSILPAAEDSLTEVGKILAHPLWGTLVQAVSILVLVSMITFVGRLFGGHGQFSDALLLLVWLEFIVALLGLVQFVVFVLYPLAGAAISVVSSILFLWLLTQFICALHGFQRPWLVFLGMVVSFLALILAMSVLLVILGITPPGTAV